MTSLAAHHTVDRTPQNASAGRLPKVLIVLSNRLYVRNFFDSGALSEVAKRYACSVALAEDVDAALLKSAFPIAGYVATDRRRLNTSTFRMYLTMWAHRRRSISYRLKFNIDVGFRKLRYVYQALALPGFLQLALFAIRKRLGPNVSVDQLLNRVRPDLVICPSPGTDLIGQDVLDSCRRMNIRSFMLINGWDNLSTKGTMDVHPDLLGVWGNEAYDHAQRIQHIDPKRIRVLGVPHFDVYRAPVPQEKINHIRALHAIPAGRKVIVFAGCSRDVAELALLDELERAITAGTLGGYHVIYRPHPWGHAASLAKDVAKRRYAHVSLDVQIGQGHAAADAKGVIHHPQYFVPELDYYPALIASAHCVISPLSTFLIEAGVMGKPALAIAFSMGKTEFPLEQIYQCEHFLYLRKTRAILTAHSPERFIQDVQRLIALVNQPNIQAQLRQDIDPIVSRTENPYAVRLADAVGEALAAPRVHG